MIEDKRVRIYKTGLYWYGYLTLFNIYIEL